MQHKIKEEDFSPPSPQSNLEVGQVFAEARLEKGISIEEAATSLHIRKFYLSAIERGEFSLLPGQIYTYGFMRKYAEFLELDFPELQRRLQLVTEDYVSLSPQDFIATYEEPSYKKFIWLSLFLTTAGIAGYLYWHSFHGVTFPQQLISPPPEEEGVSEPTHIIEEIMPMQSMPLPAPVSAPVVSIEKPATLVMRASQPTWFEIRAANGELIVMQTLKAGEDYVIPSQKGLVLNIGNAGGIELLHEGTALPSLGKVGQVRKGIELDLIIEKR